jgi:hypothetical protein
MYVRVYVCMYVCMYVRIIHTHTHTHTPVICVRNVVPQHNKTANFILRKGTCSKYIQIVYITILQYILLLLLFSLATQPSLGLGLLHKIRLNFLEASQ